MFSSSKIIVLISPSKIQIAEVHHDKTIVIQHIQDLDWTAETLPEILQMVKKDYGTTIRLLLSEELTYIINLIVPLDLKNPREEIRKKAEEIIPEDFSQTLWDFREMLVIKDDQQLPKQKVVQVIAIVHQYLDTIVKPFVLSGITVEAVEPVSSALARLTADYADPHFVIFRNQSTLLACFYQGLVISTEIADRQIDVARIPILDAFVRSRFSFIGESIQKIIIIDSDAVIETAPFEKAGYNVQIADLNPLIGMAMKEDIRGLDEHVLNIDLHQYRARATTATEKQNRSSELVTAPPSITAEPIKTANLMLEATQSNKSLIIAIVTVLIIAIIGLAVYIIRQNSVAEKAKQQTQTKPVLKVVTIPTATPTPDPQRYTIKVLNGSGTPGKAQKIRDMLTEKGFKVLETDNADKSTYEKTEIRSKGDVSPSFLNMLQPTFSSPSAVLSTIEVAPEDKTDVTVIVGRMR